MLKLDIDRDSSKPVSEQLADQLRFHLATGQISTGETLPSTRKVAERLGISFHTVRKAYQALVDAGMAESRPGSGFVACEFRPSDKSARLEAGADVMARAVQELVAMGLDEGEIEYLLDEQLSQITAEEESAKVIFCASFTEFAEAGARRLAEYFGLTVDAVPLALLESHLDADYVVAPFPIARQIHAQVPRADIVGVRTQLPAEAVELASRMFDHETLLLVVRYSDGIPALTRRLRTDAGFTGQILAAVMEDADPRLGSLVRQADAVLYTPDTARRMRAHLRAAPVNAPVELMLTAPELERIRPQLPL